MQIYRRTVSKIVSGFYVFGEKLPSKRAAAEEYGVSVITVEHAYSLLCDEGYAESRERSGIYVLYREGDPFAAEHASAKKTVRQQNSAANRENGREFPFSVLAGTMRRVLAEQGEKLLEKSPNDGCPELKRAISDYLGRSRGMKVPPSDIIIGSGAEYLYMLLARIFGRGAVVGIEDPSYEKIKKIYTSQGLVCRELKLGADGISGRELSETDAKILHVTPFNSFPSGITASAPKRLEYTRWADMNGAILVEDDFDSEFTLSGRAFDTLYSIDTGGRVIYMNTFSKTIGAGIRIGYMVIPPRLIDAYRQSCGFLSCTVPVFEQLLIAELLESGDFERHIRKVRRKMR